MSVNSLNLTRREVLGGIGGLIAGAGAFSGGNKAHGQFPFFPMAAQVPISGKAGPGMEPIDAGMLHIMARHGIAGAALAITRDGKLLLAKGYGWADAARSLAVEPETLFGLASLSKPFTAFAVLKLVELGKLDLDQRVLDIVKDIRPPQGVEMDPLLNDITVRQCLNHSGGWDRTIDGDPIYWEPQICWMLRVHPPLSPAQSLSFALSRPLPFKPGTDAKYSNIGYILLGEVIAKVSGQSYERFVAEHVLKPVGIQRAALHPVPARYMKGESLRYAPGTLFPLPPMCSPMLNAAGGWSASVVDMARFLTNADGSRGKPVLSEKTRRIMLQPPPKPLAADADGCYFGLGWENVRVDGNDHSYLKEGRHPGIRTFMKHFSSGVNVVLLCNTSAEFDPIDMRIAAVAVRRVRQSIEKLDRKYPDVDLFKEFS